MGADHDTGGGGGKGYIVHVEVVTANAEIIISTLPQVRVLWLVLLLTQVQFFWNQVSEVMESCLLRY